MTVRKVSLMTAKVKSQVLLLVLPPRDHPLLILKLALLLALKCLEHPSSLEVQLIKMKPQTKKRHLTPIVGDQALKEPKLRFTQRLKKKMNGLQFRNSTLFYITRSKSRPFFVIRNVSVSLKKNLTNNYRRRILVDAPKLKSVVCTKTFRNSMSSFLKKRR